MTKTTEIVLGRWTLGEKSRKWVAIPELSDEDLHSYISDTKAQIRLRQRALEAAEYEAHKRKLFVTKNETQK